MTTPILMDTRPSTLWVLLRDHGNPDPPALLPPLSLAASPQALVGVHMSLVGVHMSLVGVHAAPACLPVSWRHAAVVHPGPLGQQFWWDPHAQD